MHKSNKAQILDFNTVFAARQIASRERRYTKFARKVAQRPVLWIFGAIFAIVAFQFTAQYLLNWFLAL